MLWLMLPLCGGCTPAKPHGSGATPPDPATKMLLDPLRNEALQPEKLIGWLGLQKSAVVADIGSGPGFLTLPLARAVPAGRVIATDVNPRFLATLAERAAQAGLHNIETRRTAPDDPELASGSIDLALLCQVDQFLPNRADYFRALVRALEPGGRIALVNFQRFQKDDRAAAAEAGLKVIAEHEPSPPFFLLLLAPKSAK